MTMEIVELIAEGDKVVGRFRCSATHLGTWRGHPPTGRRFERVDEVYIFRVTDGQIAEAWGIEDTRSRERQLGLPNFTLAAAVDMLTAHDTSGTTTSPNPGDSITPAHSYEGTSCACFAEPSPSR